jgi:hypothetical protein
LLAGAEKDRVGVRERLVGKRCDMQTAERDVRTSRAVVIGDSIRAIRIRDVNLNQDEIGSILEIERHHVLVDQYRAIVGTEKRGERRETERREERVLDRTPVRARRLGERREDQFDGQRSRGSGHRHAL